VCVRPCTPFGTDCTGGLNCSDVNTDADGSNNFAVCRSVGTSNSACSANTDCIADHICSTGLSGLSCNSLCDSTHMCAGIVPICEPITGMPNAGGVCLL
jgi:hypothetical protein